MKKEKLSLKGIKNVLSRSELKKIMAGSGSCIPDGEVCGWVAPSAYCCGNSVCTPSGGTGAYVCKSWHD